MTSFEDSKNLCELILHMRNLIKRKRVRIAFLGYTDLMLTDTDWNELGITQDALENRDNWEKLTQIHKRQDIKVVPTLSSALKSLIGEQFDLAIFDITKYEGNEIEWDFNHPIPKKFRGKFDIVIDAGTCEHIFNIAQALSNVQLMLCQNGIAYHGGPLCWPNHGFYGYNPTLFADFYEANDCEILEMFLQTNFSTVDGERHRVTVNVPEYDRFQMSKLLEGHTELLKVEFNLCTAVLKKQISNGIKFPIQKKYQQKSNWI